MKTYLRPFQGKVTVISVAPTPEIVAFAMSRFSRSADDMATSLVKVTGYAEKRQARFFEENYHGYGHASIGDQAHIGFAVEDVSILAIFYLWQMLELVDGQERSTRYQPFDKTGFSLFELPSNSLDKALISRVADGAFSTYLATHRAVLAHYEERYPDSRLFEEGGGMTREQLAKQLECEPDEVSDRELEHANHTQADKIRKARAFDVARYCLPLCTNTSAGYIMSARSAERIIALLHVHPWPEMQWLGQAIQEALTPHLPNLLKYTQANLSELSRHQALGQIVTELKLNQIEPAEFGASMDYPSRRSLLNIAARLLYPHHNSSWSTALAIIEDQGPRMWQCIIDEGGWQRQPKEDFPRDSRGGEITVELVMDIGAARDLNRHRGTFKQYQWGSLGTLGVTLGVMHSEIPIDGRSQVEDFLDYQRRMGIQHHRGLLPLATKIRAVYHMSWQQLIYMLELRSIAGGHPAYRYLTAKMLDAIAHLDADMHQHLLLKRSQGAFRFLPYEATEGKFFVR